MVLPDAIFPDIAISFFICPRWPDEGLVLLDLDGLAALIQACDVVVSIDNATVHLAGALGKDVRILLPYACDWRWQYDISTSYWYDSARLYRQGADRDWASVLAELDIDINGK